MDNKSSKKNQILWIEDQLLELEAGVKEVTDLLNMRYNHVKIIRAEWVSKAEEEINRLKDTPPDLILLDMMLPRTEDDYKNKKVDLNAGFLIWHRLRKQREWGLKIANIPILVVTALSRPLFRPMMEGDKKMKWLEKPVGPSTMANEIIALLSPDSAKERG